MVLNIFLKTIFKTVSFDVKTWQEFSSHGPGPQEPADPASKREEKIARYKRCKELDEKVAYLFRGISLAAVGSLKEIELL